MPSELANVKCVFWQAPLFGSEKQGGHKRSHSVSGFPILSNTYVSPFLWFEAFSRVFLSQFLLVTGGGGFFVQLFVWVGHSSCTLTSLGGSGLMPERLYCSEGTRGIGGIGGGIILQQTSKLAPLEVACGNNLPSHQLTWNLTGGPFIGGRQLPRTV